MPNSLSFLSHSLPELRTLRIDYCGRFSTSSFASLSYASNLHVLDIPHNHNFNNDCLQHLENMVHLRKLDLSFTGVTGDSRPLKILIQNLFQLEELDLSFCNIGNQGAITGALYSSRSRLRVLHLSRCGLADDDLNGIGALKNTLEVLVLDKNYPLTNEALVHCKDLVKLKVLDLAHCSDIDDLSPLKDCPNLEELDVLHCDSLTDDAFRIFSEEPNSFPSLRVLGLNDCMELTEKVFEHLAKNNHLVYQLKELNVEEILELFPSSPQTAWNNICQLRGLRRITGVLSGLESESDRNKLKGEIMRRLKNLEELD